MKRIIFLLITWMTAFQLYSQVPQSFTYQAIVRDNAGNVISNQNVAFRISILQGSTNGTSVYTENHSATTSNFGLVSLQIGKGTQVSGDFTSIDWATQAHFLKIEIDETGGADYTILGVSQLLSVPYALYAESVSKKDDADADPQNEIQDLSISGNTLTITLNGTPTAIDLSPYMDNTDNQSLSLDGKILSISNGNSVEFTDSVDLDPDPTNEIQDLNLSGNTLTITLNGTPTAIDLSPYLDNTDNQSLSLSGHELILSNGGSILLPDTVGPDTDPQNEIQDLNLDGHILTISLNGSPTAIDLSPYLDNTDNQSLSLSGHELILSNGGSILLPDTVGPDTDTLNEIQDLQLAGNTLTITKNAAATDIDLSGYLDNTDQQTLSFQNDSLSISGGNIITFPYDSALWKKTNDDIIYTSGNVGIGSESPKSKLEVKADASFTELDTLFSVKDKDGHVVFAVFPDGAKVYVNNSSKGNVGGFAVSGRTASKALEYDLMKITPDSTRIYVSDTSAKGNVGGFAVSGRTASKSFGENYLYVAPTSTQVFVNQSAKGTVGGFAVSGRTASKGVIEDIFLSTPDSTRIYVNDTVSKGNVGGFAVSGRSAGKTSANKFMDLTPDNYFIGHQSGSANTTGLYNSFLGYESGIANSSGSNNSFLGYRSGFSNISGNNNLFLGVSSGYANTTGGNNTFVGIQSGYSNTTGTNNTFIGSYSGLSNTEGYNNNFMGYNSGVSNTTGDGNTFIGNYVGYSNTTGNYNSFIGYRSGYYNNANYNSFMGYYSGYNTTSGGLNVFLGYYSGYSNTTGASNVFIGEMAGRFNTTASYNVFIGRRSGYYNTNGGITGTQGYYNTFLGYYSGFSNRTGAQNIMIGYLSGFSSNSGDDNIFIGTNCGYNNISGSNNVFIGNYAGYNNTNSDNVFIGDLSGYTNTSGTKNVFLGYESGYYNNNGSQNVFIGDQAGKANTSGSSNIFIGNEAGTASTSGTSNTMIGDRAGTATTTGFYNTIIGYAAGMDNTTGAYNTMLGMNAGGNLTTGRYNTFIGMNAGSQNNGDRNIFIGMNAGWNETGSNLFIVQNNPSDQPILYGDFSANYLKVIGDLQYTGTLSDVSDIRLKKNIQVLDGVMEKIKFFRGVYYDWKHEIEPDLVSEKGRQIGVIAQEVEKVYPEVVTTNEKGYKMVDYTKLVPVLLEAIKEQQHIIDNQQQENKNLQERIARIEAILEIQ